MELLNWKALLLAAFANFVVGSLWYNPKTFGPAWMREAGLTEESMKKGNMVKIFGFTLLFALMLSTAIFPLVVHQMHLYSICNHQLIGTDLAAKTMAEADIAGFMGKYGNEFRTFKHGAFHGLMFSIFLVLPIQGTNALFEGKSWKYIFINAGYWALSLMLMGGIISGWQK
ncbi:DUF1761 domain-containing protein [Lacihabitans sp. LS3-19]|uniref:DUF1761 domain-containing protein n=1 Tax=Lacihabitans sp. LS3-19 TaxID=2487335 RepID=UPI0020CC20E0|nr:DUF1761 domain-containing protein [Lacihabitans sp. LS3-19]MCP9766625.1 DUF1761 domain-containing protein [Lacihabitans sp. LS3-19]